MSKQKIYLAGGLTNNWHNKVISKFEDKFIFFNPRNHNLPESAMFTTWDLHFVRQSDILFGYLEKENPSGFGLSLEIGYAKALGKTIILVDEKSVRDEDFANRFKIVRESSNIVLSNFADGLSYLEKYALHLK